MKKLLVGMLMAAALATVAAAPALADAKGKRVANIITSTKNPFVAALSSTLEKEGEALGMKVITLSTNYDAAIQAQQINEAIAQKYDMITLLPIDARAIVPALTRAKEAGVPVVLVNSPIDPTYNDLFLSFVGENQEDFGRIAGKSLIQAVHNRKTAKTAIISGTLSESTPQMRVKGFKEAVAKDPKIQIVATEDAHWDMANSERIAGQLLARYAAQGGLDAIYAMADNMAHGVIQAAKAADIPLGTDDGKLVIVSGTCMKFGIDHIRAGEQYSTATQIPARTGKAAIELIAAYFDGKSVPNQKILPVEAITKDNVDTYAEACTY
ncbi:MAG: sugar ABC transporter substrate-binding protein [Xanthobacteraceae bacterium]